MNEDDVNAIMEKLVTYAECSSCNCKECHRPKTPVTLDCFNKHPGWVIITPNCIKNVLMEYEVFGVKK